MIRQMKKLSKTVKKTKRKVFAYCRKHIPILNQWKPFKKKLWVLRYHLIGSVDEKRIVFCSNGGKDYSGYPAYLYEQMKRDDRYRDYKFSWLFQKKDAYKNLNDERTRIYNLGSKKGIHAICHAHYLVTNKNLPDYIRLRKTQIFVFEPEEHYGYFFYGDKKAPAETEEFHTLPCRDSFRRADYIVCPDIHRKERLAFVCRALENCDTAFISASYLEYIRDIPISSDVLSKQGILNDKKKVLFSLKDSWYVKDSFLRELEQKSHENWVYLFRKQIFLLPDAAVEKHTVHPVRGYQDSFEETSEGVSDCEKFDYDTSHTFFGCPGTFGKNEVYAMADVVVTNQLSNILECMWLGKPVIVLLDEWMYRDDTERQAIFQLKKRYSELTMIYLSQLDTYLEKGVSSLTDVSWEEYTVSQKTTDRLYDFLDPELGSADGSIKRYLRNKKYLFELLKKMHQGVYVARAVKKKSVTQAKQLAKFLDLKLLFIYYSCDGFLRKREICFTQNSRKLISYQNKYEGQRCFLIGNGPSLSVSDLEMLQKEITFACNGIYKLFPETKWRPTYFCMIDALIAKYRSEELVETITCPMFTNMNTRDLMKVHPKELIFARNLGESEYRVSGNFAAYYVPSGATVMTFMLELAMYMGFKEIYLLGVDCTSSLTSKGHCVKGYVSEELIQKDIERIRKRLNDPTLDAGQVAAYYFDKSTSCYRVIREYADKKGICIYNATRGGMLEIFERRSLEEVLCDGKENESLSIINRRIKE